MPSITTGLALRLPSFFSRWAPKPAPAPESSSTASSSSSSACSSVSPPAGPNPLFITWQWSSSIHLTRTANGFEAPVRIPWQDKITYKFVVDGNWTTSDREPTETDSSGFMNNVYTAPPRPEPRAAIEEPPTVDVTEPEPQVTSTGATVGPETETTGTGTGKEAKKRLSFVDLIGGTVSSIAGQIHESIVAPAVAFANQFDEPYEAPTPAAEAEPRSFVQEIKDAIAPIVSSAEPAVEKAKETAEPVVEKAEETAAPVVDKAQEVGAPAVEKAQEAVEPVVEKAQESAAQVAPDASELESKEAEVEYVQVGFYAHPIPNRLLTRICSSF